MILLDEVHNGRMRLDERTTMVARDRVGGSGVLLRDHVYSRCADRDLRMTRENEDTRHGVDAEPHLLIARIGREVYRHYNPDVELPPLPQVR